MKRLFISLLCLFYASLVFAADVEGNFGIFRVVLHDKSGTFSLYMENTRNNKYIPILNSLDNSSGTRFYLKAGETVYTLSKTAGVPVNQFLTDSGFKVEYIVKGKALVTLNYTIVSSKDGTLNEFSDVIIVDVVITNTSTKTDTFALKTLFDTVLGEGVSKHFSTKTFPVINEEISFSSMYADKWIRTSDGFNTMQFLLDGDTISRPLSVTLANRDILLTDVWTPTVISGRGFNSLFSFNNSAVSIQWSNSSIAPKAQSAMRFYVTASSAEQIPSDTSAAFFSGGKAAEISSGMMLIQEQPVEESAAPVVIPPATAVTSDAQIPAVPEDVKLAEETPSPVDDSLFDDKTLQDVNPYVYDQPIKEEQLDPEYINTLLERIENLEAESSDIDREEILRLNAELDAILEFLRR